MAAKNEPLYVISVAARMAGLHAQTLRHYERAGLLAPRRSPGNVRFYSTRDIERVRRIRSLMEDLGVNLAGVEVILRLRERIGALEGELAQLKQPQI
ncbi:MAG: MerR family transcriptional regulator [Chloroflexi bacterium]|nr:MerR family transcriptional regulator [Chloroflexota bacterium]